MRYQNHNLAEVSVVLCMIVKNTKIDRFTSYMRLADVNNPSAVVRLTCIPSAESFVPTSVPKCSETLSRIIEEVKSQNLLLLLARKSGLAPLSLSSILMYVIWGNSITGGYSD